MSRPVKSSITRSLAVVGLLTLAENVSAQQNPIISTSLDVLPYSNVENPALGGLQDPVGVRITNARLALNLPMRAGEQTLVTHGLDVSVLGFSYDRGIPREFHTPDQLYDVSYRFTLSTLISDNWAATVLAQPGIASDFENVTWNHLRFQGGIIFTTAPNENTRLGFGAVVQNNFGEVLPLPAFNLRWQSESARIDMQLPKHAGFMLTPGNAVEIGLRANVEGNHYRIGRDTTLADDPIVNYSNLTVGPAVHLKLSSIVRATVSGGISAVRRFQVTSGSANELRETDLERSGFVRFGIEVWTASFDGR